MQKVYRSEMSLIHEHSHYFYVLRGEYLVPMTPRGGWFNRSTRHTAVDDISSKSAIGSSFNKSGLGKKLKKKLIFSQSMVIDVDPNKVCRHTLHIGTRFDEYAPYL